MAISCIAITYLGLKTPEEIEDEHKKADNLELKKANEVLKLTQALQAALAAGDIKVVKETNSQIEWIYKQN